MNHKILKLNNFYLIVNRSGYFLKTRFQEDFDYVRTWGGILFVDIVKNSKMVFYKVGSTILKKKINLLPVAKPQSQTLWFDISELDLKNGNHINKIWIGGKDEDFEKL